MSAREQLEERAIMFDKVEKEFKKIEAELRRIKDLFNKDGWVIRIITLVEDHKISAPLGRLLIFKLICDGEDPDIFVFSFIKEMETVLKRKVKKGGIALLRARRKEEEVI